MATIKDISMKCNVSVSTVSKVLNGYKEIGEETTKAVLQAAQELGYVPNSYARQLKIKKSFNIGVMFDTLSSHGLKNEYFFVKVSVDKLFKIIVKAIFYKLCENFRLNLDISYITIIVIYKMYRPYTIVERKIFKKWR